MGAGAGSYHHYRRCTRDSGTTESVHVECPKCAQEVRELSTGRSYRDRKAYLFLERHNGGPKRWYGTFRST